MKTVELIYDSYNTRLKILIDGQPLSTYSSLQQYQDEKFLEWCGIILEELYLECNRSEYILKFTGREEEHKILKKIANTYSHCKEYQFIPFENNMPFEIRMQKLDQICRTSKIGIEQQKRMIAFLLDDSYKGIEADLLEMNMKNAYCSVDVCIKEKTSDIGQDIDAVIVFSARNYWEQYAEGIQNKAVYGIEVSDGIESCVEIYRGFLGTSVHVEDVSDAIFDILKLDLLLDCYQKTADAILEKTKKGNYYHQVLELKRIENEIVVKIEKNEVEVGKSIEISFLENGSRTKKNILFEYEKKGIVEVEKMAIKGIKEGKTKVFMFKSGELNPFYTLEITAIKRNRIQKIIMLDDDILIGEGDRYRVSYEFSPLDADNVDQVRFDSEHPEIVSIDQKGFLTAKKAGRCRIFCSAEQISGFCYCQVKPYISGIGLGENDISLRIGEEKEIDIKIYPGDTIEKMPKIYSDDIAVANVQGTKIMGVGKGKTRVHVRNRKGTVDEIINVKVKKGLLF